MQLINVGAIFLNTNKKDYDFVNDQGKRFTGTNHFIDVYDRDSQTVFHILDNLSQAEFYVKEHNIQSNTEVNILVKLEVKYGKTKMEFIDFIDDAYLISILDNLIEKGGKD